MGLKSTSDHWCNRSDVVIIGIPGCHKIVDDILITANSLDELFDKIRQVLLRCRETGLTICKRKLKVSTALSFAGFHISPEGIQPDPSKVSAIKNFPTPTDVPAVLSFLGLANQFGQFLPDLAMATSRIRGLLKKNVVFQWLPEHEEEFTFVKDLLTSPMLVKFFDPTLPTSLLTDASKLNGLGYALLQHAPDGRIHLIQAGSRSLIAAEKNYAPIEQECLGAIWAMDKCRYFLKGCPEFKLVTDHQPLIGIFRKYLSEVENKRLQRFRERVMDLAFNVEWVEGKSHLIADALSRYPIPHNERTKEQAYLVSPVLHSLDPNLSGLVAAAKACDTYQRLINAVTNGADFKLIPATDPISIYKSVRDNLSLHDSGLLVYNSDRLVVPVSERPHILELLHMGHSGIVKTRALARQLYYWPFMSRDVKDMISRCPACQEHLPHQRPQPLTETKANAPMEHTSADLFSLAGKNYLVLADRYSGMVWADRLSSTSTSAVTNCLDKWLYETGFPRYLRTDGGPQFRGPFEEWCQKHSIIHEVSSPYHPQSNGHAEAAVKTAKFLLDKVDAKLDAFRQHLFAWRNTPRPDGFAPADLFYGRRQRSQLPSIRADTCDPDAASAREKLRSTAKANFDAHAAALPPLQAGQTVLFSSKGKGTAWGGKATVQAARPDGQSYHIQPEDGSAATIRNRALLRSVPEEDNTEN